MVRKVLIVLLAFSFLLCGCFTPRRDKYTYTFWNSGEQIFSIEILKKTHETGSENDPTEVVFVLAEDAHTAFLDELTTLPGEHLSLEPLTGLGPYIVRITYCDGTIALIGYANTVYQYPDGSRKYYYFCFAYDSFQGMIDRTLTVAVEP